MDLQKSSVETNQQPHQISLIQTVDWLLMKDQFEAARQLLRSIFELKFTPHFDFLNFIFERATRAKDFELAVHCAQAIALHNHSIENQVRLAQAFHRNFQLVESEKIYLELLEQHPNQFSLITSLALVLETQGRWNETARLLRLVIEHSTDSSQRLFAEYKLGWHVIREGNFRLGMQMTRLGRSTQKWGSYCDFYSAPRLECDFSVFGKTILVCGEGGLGDEMINYRFCRTLQERGAYVIYRNYHSSLKEVLSRLKFSDEFLDHNETPTKSYDYWVAAMDLPAALNLNANELRPDPYLKSDSASLKKWQDRLSRKDQKKHVLRVGIKWAGDTETDRQQRRTLPLHLVQRFVANPKAEFYSFQLDSNDNHLVPGLIDISHELKSWDDTLAALEQMDLVIASCSSLVHAAAALGKKTWVLTTTTPYYIWAPEKNTSPWYKDVQLFREACLNDWENVFQEVQTSLEKL